MELFIDSADLKEIERFLSWGVCDGVTTNPTLMRRQGVTTPDKAKKLQVAIAKLIYPRPLSIEVTSDKPKEILKQAHEFVTWADNVLVKVTVSDRNGNSLLPVIYQLGSEGISLNVTMILTKTQALLAAKALDAGLKAASQPTRFHPVISVFGGRMSEELGEAKVTQILAELRQWLDLHHMNTRLLTASVRTPEQLDLWSATGTHIMTVPPNVLVESQVSAKSIEGVKRFLEDSKQVKK